MRFISLQLARLAALTIFGYAGTASAGFFDVCLVPGNQTIQVNFDTLVRNEVAPLPTGSQDNCDIEVADGVTLRFVNVTVPPTSKRINYSGSSTSRLLILRSNIRACDSDVFGFGYMEINESDISDPEGEAGQNCDVKEMFVTGEAKIVRSIMRSFGDGDFNIRVQSSTAGVTIRGSFFSSSDDLSLATVAPTARLEVLRSRLDSAATTEILGAGLTSVIQNRFNAVGGVTVTGNPCIANRNTPEVICTSPP